MGKINVLSFAVANLIAAGEVVDRPASVIKELMENAIDAGATRITIEIQNGGVTFMRVSDNGCGMAAEDLPIAVRRHATSKIRDAEDLDGILTLGFRGEALAAIASVSHLRIFSKTPTAPMGAMLESVGGEEVTLTEQGCSDGTTVIVEDLFANVPARRKFLKKDATEAMAVAANVEKVALSRPDIAFRLIVDGNVRLETAGDGDLRHTVYAVFGKDFASRLIEVDTREEGGIRVNGFIGRPDNAKANRNFQNYFINGRYVKSKTACAAVEQAYCSYMPPEKFPCCILNLQINPAAVDVNVHPAKLEVKFSNEKPVFEAIYYAVRNALEQDRQRPDIKLNQGHISVEEARRLFAEAEPTKRPRVSDAIAPIRDGRQESLKKQQIKMELPTMQTPPSVSPRESIPSIPRSGEMRYAQPPVPPVPPVGQVSTEARREAAGSERRSAVSEGKPFRATLNLTDLPSDPVPPTPISTPAAVPSPKPQTAPQRPEGEAAVTIPAVSEPPASAPSAPPSSNSPHAQMLAKYLREYEAGAIVQGDHAQDDEPTADIPNTPDIPDAAPLQGTPDTFPIPATAESVLPAAPQKETAPMMSETPPAAEAIPADPSAASTPPTEVEPPHYRIIGEAWNSYILLEVGDKLLLIDQHAAHERIIFEQFKSAMRTHDPLSQMLMLPIEFELSTEDVQILGDYRAEIEAIGFTYDADGKRISVSAIPVGVESGAVEDMFAVMADRIRTETGSAQLTRDIMFEKALYQASCKAAIKAGRVYAAEHIAWICDKLMRIPDITVCPHGRPVAMTLSRSNLDRQFKRT